ncbi:sigma-70 family RNA polymerase sigma factor [Planomonospora sp. ID67723]|uniref:RNA polymerase sigma factor n=1 Tax=Planomonospora sp. ID67723 TaxID=2738134 RepID=UPI0018C41178|nr:sigma-70 family RNA polymerase sigma factor [Planomonospora sp. ID67723]MBG0827487.1 sigma-70 family RNA polymerase sigma factor [Planomonospora sp. ID67723]
MNDPEAQFIELYDRYYRSVLGYVLLRADPGMAEDITSETFLVAWRRFDKMPEPPLPWLFGVARNLLRNQRARRLRGDALLARLAELNHVAEGDVADRVTDREVALAALGHLREDDVEAVILAGWYGLTPQEASQVVGCSQRTYNVRLHRARRRLSDAIKIELALLAF